MLDILTLGVMCACISAFIILLAKKWKVTDFLQMHGTEWTSELAKCDFCMSFWVSTFVGFVAVCLFKDVNYWAVTSIVSAVITRKIL